MFLLITNIITNIYLIIKFIRTQENQLPLMSRGEQIVVLHWKVDRKSKEHAVYTKQGANRANKVHYSLQEIERTETT